MHLSVQSIYDCQCDECVELPKQLNLALGDKFKSVLKAGEKAFKKLHSNGKYNADDLKTEKEYQDLIKETFKAFDMAITDNDMPEGMTRALQSDAFLFGQLKTHAQLFEASKLLLKDDGTLKTYSELSNDFNKLNVQYNETYLNSEYQFAVSSSQMAAKWSDLGSEDRYYLQYRTAKDERVRASHQVLADITLPKTDSFWISYYPPNGWNCRCTAIEVLQSKYTASDSVDSINKGEAATTQIDKNGKNRLEMFRFNPGAQKIVFPPKHPYHKVAGSNALKMQKESPSTINLKDFIKGDIPTNAEVKNILLKYAELHPDDFRNGLDDILFTRSTSYMMQHAMAYSPITGQWVRGSKIYISSHTFSYNGFNPLQEFKAGLAAIKKGEKMTFNQEYSFESLWHEILHAKTKSSPKKLAQVGLKNMETVNQFCARHTYNDFVERLGGEAIHKKEILDNGYGYQSWVTEFRERLKNEGVEEKTALEKLFPELMKDYGSLGQKIKELF
ncbi:MAG: hypothetical protein JST78_09620 [Bacteroidetes bacterium]|nr:hypothetical protein [Bacteroidota bacterium]